MIWVIGYIIVSMIVTPLVIAFFIGANGGLGNDQ